MMKEEMVQKGSSCSFEKARRHAVVAIFAVVAVVMALATAPGTACASQALLTWNATTTNADGTPITDLAGYNVYIGSAPGAYDRSVDAGNLQSYTVANL